VIIRLFCDFAGAGTFGKLLVYCLSSLVVIFCFIINFGGCAPAFALDEMVPVAYTANTALNTVSVIDMRDNSIFATVYEVNSPTGLAASPDGKWLYVTNGEIGKVSYINMSSYRVTGTIPVGNMPCGIAMSPDGGTAYVTNYLDNTVSVINTTDRKANGTINVGKGPYGIRVNPRNGEAYVVNSDDGSIAVIRDNSVVATILAGDNTAKGLAVTPDGSRLLVLDKDRNTVSVINTTTYQVVNAVNTGVGPSGIAISPDGWYAFITNPGSGNISDLQISDNTIRVSFSLDNGSVIGFRPDGRMIYVVTAPSGNIKAIDAVTGEVKATIGVRATDMEVALVSGAMLVDATPPETSLNLFGENNTDGSYIGKVLCNITAVDYPGGTELTNSEYSFDGMTWAPYTSNFTLRNPGRTIVHYRSADKFGNEEWPRSKVIYIVAEASGISPSPIPAISPANASIWTGPSATVPVSSPPASGTPKPTPGFEAIPAIMGMLGIGFFIRNKQLGNS